MFRKIESYVTPIILSHVDKYIKNFKSEDTQVSLWSGAVVLHNLELKPNVIQDEFNLPFYLSSGYIHELIIHVPWMKIMSEPIMITINTIECVLTLKTESWSEAKQPEKNKNRNEQETPPGYVQSLVNRIVNNISFRCNNLILKYVEEDIVVSVNIKHLYLDSVNGNWEPTFTDITVDDLHLRKLITLSDLTLCLDKRNAAGKIETFLEPLLYRCELKIKLDSSYSGLLQKNPLYVRCHLSSPKIEISISHQQIPMVIRLAALFWALKKKHIHIVHNVDSNRENTGNSPVLPTTEQSENASDGFEDSWTGWALSFMTPIYSSEDEGVTSKKFDPVMLFGIDLKNVSMVFKIPESATTSNTIMSNKKIKQVSTAKLILSYVMAEMSSCGQRFCLRGGFKKIELFPENQCICGIIDGHTSDVSERLHSTTKFLESTTNIEGSEDIGWPIEYNEESIVKEMSDEEMMVICPALSLTYTYILTLPEDYDDSHSEISTDLEYSNFKETSMLNVACGPMSWFLSAGLIHRMTMIKSASDMYDYAPYYLIKPLLRKHELPPPTTDDYDTFMEFIPRFSIRLYAFNPSIIISVWDHPEITDDKKAMSPKTSTSFCEQNYYKSLQKIPHLLFEINDVEITLSQPMYPIRVTYVICQLPDPPSTMFDACHKLFNIKVNNLRCRLSQKLKEAVNLSDIEKGSSKNKNLSLPILNDCTFHFILKTLILPEYWTDVNSVVINDYSLNIDNGSFCGTMPKFITSLYILNGVLKMDHKCPHINELLISSLLNDILDDDAVHLELVFDGILMRKINLIDTSTYRLVVNNIKAFAIKSNKDTLSDDTVWIFCAPDNTKNQSGPFFKVVYQHSSNEMYASFLTAKVEESSLVFDPFLYQFITYKYSIKNNSYKLPSEKERSPTPKRPSSERTHKRSLDESTIHQSSKVSYKYASLQSQSDREKDFVHSTTPTPLPSTSKNYEEVEDSFSKVPENNPCKADIFAKLVCKHRQLAVSLEIEPLMVYMPMKPVSAVNHQTVYDAIKASVLLDNHCDLESVLVLRLSSINIKSSTLKKHLLEFCVHGLPSKIPSTVWDSEMTSYPWQINLPNLSCSTLSRSKENNIVSRNVLKPVTTNIVISLATKLSKENLLEQRSSQTTRKDCNKSNSADSPKESESSSSIASEMGAGELFSLAVVVHVDVGWVILSTNQQQISTLSILTHGLMELSSSLNRNVDLEYSNRISRDQSFTFNVHERNSLDNSYTSDTQSGKNATKDQKGFSCNDSGINEDSHAKEATPVRNIKVLLTSWIQLTISRFTAKCYGTSKKVVESASKSSLEIEQSVNNLKLVFDVEDIMTSLDVHPEYIKVKCKMVTAYMKYYKRESIQSAWVLGEHNGIILRGRENDGPLKQNEETSFIFVTLTFARCSSVHNKWNDAGKKVIRKFDNTTGEFIWEIEVSMQSLDIILSLHCLEPFLVAFSPAFCDVQCDSLKNNKMKDSNKKSFSIFRSPETWSSAIFPLCYFESHQIRFILPVNHKVLNKHHDVVVLQIDKFSILPVAENPMCRQTLRPDLYEVAAREGWLGLPGGPLEDRQAQLTLKGISIYTCHWNAIAQMEEPDDNSVNENPAVRWNNLTVTSGSLSSDQILTVVKNVDIHIVLALAMFYDTTLVSGPAIDIGLVTDTEITISTSQLKLICSLYYECLEALDSVGKKNYCLSGETLHCLPAIKLCPFNTYITRTVPLSKKSKVTLNTIPKLMESKSVHSQSLSDTGIVSDKTSSITPRKSDLNNILGSETKSKKPIRKKKTEYFDIVCTLGKVSLLFYEDNFMKKTTQSQNITPLLFIMLHQPNFFVSLRQTNMTMQASIFSAQISVGDKISTNSLAVDAFQLHILETKPGTPNIVTGIPPALVTIKIEQNSDSWSSVKLAVDCPIMFSVSETRIGQLKHIQDFVNLAICSHIAEDSNKSQNESSTSMYAENSFHSIFGKLVSVDLSIAQIVLNLERNETSDCTLSFSSLNLQSSINPRLEKVFIVGLLQSLTLSLKDGHNNSRQIIINPWTIGMESTISWEPWRDFPSTKPVYQILLDTDKLIVHLGMKEIIVLQELIQYWTTVVTKKFQSKSNLSDGVGRRTVKKSKTSDFWSQASLNDQHYKDDLRAGAFKYVNCVNDTVPLPYQVVIGQRQISWCYPHPRALTRLYSYPLPFQLEAGVNVTDTVVCTLQYYSEVMHCFMFYAKFYIRQDQAIKLDLPINDQYMKLATVWRIEMHLPSEDLQTPLQSKERAIFDKSKFLTTISSKTKQPIIKSDVDSTPLPVSPKMLPGCLRVDSYSSSNAFPAIQFAFKLPQFDVHLYNSYNHSYSFADRNRMYPLDSFLPPPYIFANINFRNNLIEGSLWNSNTGLLNFDLDFFADVLNNSDFSLSRAIWCRETHGTVWWGGRNIKQNSDTGNYNSQKILKNPPVNGVSIKIENAGMKIGSHMLNTLFVATKKNTDSECSKCLGNLRIENLMHRYVIKNDTCVALRIGQDDTKEDLLLAPGTATLYQWMHHKKPHLLSFAAHDGDWHTSKGFQIDECGIQQCQLVGELGLPSLGAVIYVEALGPCHRSVTLSGCITLFNLLDEKIEFKLYQRKPDEKPMVSPIFTLDENSQHPSLFVDTTCESAFRLHFAGSSAGWTGDIPLKPCPKGTLPWLVKVPVKAEVEFICLWCRVLKDADTGRIIVVLSPLYMIRSHFHNVLEVTLTTEDSDKSMACCVMGKGTVHPLKLPGTTETNHNIIFTNRNVDDQPTTGLNVPFAFDRDLSKNKFATSTTNFDTVLENLKKWLKEPHEGSDIQNEYEDYKWIPLHSQYPEEIIVRFNYDVESIDSVIIEISPWTFFYNYTELNLTLLDIEKCEMCTLEHQSLATPPMSKLNPYSYISWIDRGYYHLSAPLAISTEISEPNDDKVVVINVSKSFLIHCRTSIAVFSVTHDIINSINAFRFSCSYVTLNRTKYDLLLVPLAIPIDSSEQIEKHNLPTKIDKQYFPLPRNDDSCYGKSITHFFLPTCMEKDNLKIYRTNDFAFYIWLSLSLDTESFGCPVRVDKFTSRRCISLKINDTSIPIVVNCKRENDQTYISISEDSLPQFLIQNNADVRIAVGHSIINFTPEGEMNEVIEECDMYKWDHHIDSGVQMYYTMPTLAKSFPDLSSDPTKPSTHLTFAYAPNENIASKEYVWSTPVNVSVTSSEQYVKLPGYNKDIKVSVIYHVHSTYITLDNISQVDISAAEIRSRLFDKSVTQILTDNISTTNWQQSYFENDSDLILMQNSQNVDQHYTQIEPSDVAEHSAQLALATEFKESDGITMYSSQLLEFLAKMNVLLTFTSLTMTLNASGDNEPKDIASVSSQNVIFTSAPTSRGANIILTVQNLQLDNPLHSSGDYDFPVVLIKKVDDGILSDDNISTQNNHKSIFNCFEKDIEFIQLLRSHVLLALKTELDIWNQEYETNSAIGEVNLVVQPLSTYIEDTYITVLLNYIAEFGPWNDDSLCDCQRFRKAKSDSLNVYVPINIVSEMSTLARPMQIGSLQIDPINVVLSLHANLHVYIALDHSPLQFSKFERNNVLTTSFRLGHALTMHYLSEAIYRAGWVVGSLEILGCPGGLARRVGAGLKALVAEPCRGLLGRGPWGFIVGMTHGSAVLLKHVTQGTAESVSMVASSVARNLDRLSFDTEHVRRTEAARRARPRGLPQGLARGFKAFALGVVGGATGLVTSPPTKGILGIVTKPLSATADFVAFTTQGLLGQVGWDPQPQPMWVQSSEECDHWPSEWQEWRLKLGNNFFAGLSVLYTCKGQHRDTGNSIALVITNKWLLLIDLERQTLQQVVDVSTLYNVTNQGTNLCISIHQEASIEDIQEWVSRTRVASYVGEHPPTIPANNNLFRISIPPSDISYTVAILIMAKEQSQNRGFAVLS